MVKFAEFYEDNTDSIYNILESEALEMTGGNATICQKAILSLRRTVPTFRNITESLKLWVAVMAFKGMKNVTMCRYVESVRSLWNKAAEREALPKAADSFAEVLAILKTLPAGEKQKSGEILSSLQEVVGNALNLSSSMRLYLDALLLAIFAGGLSLKKVVSLRSDSSEMGYLLEIPQAARIIRDHAAPRQKYLLPLSQGRRTDKKISEALEEKLSVVIHYLRGELNPDPTYLWVHAAFHCGVSLSEIRAMISDLPESLKILEIVSPAHLEPSDRLRICSHVAQAIVDAQPHWFAMRLRRGVTPEDVSGRFKEHNNGVKPLALWYPCEEIARRVGKKLTIETRAYISDVLFFRCEIANVRPLFAEIGDLAWCYRVSSNVNASYSIISDRDMRIFKRRIGQLNEATEIRAMEKEELQVGQTVRITDGIMAGYTGEIRTLPSSGRRQLRLLVTIDRGLLVTLDIPDDAIVPVE